MIHKDSKEAAVYQLVVAKGGPKLQPSKPGDETPARAMRSRGQIDLHNATMHMLAAVLTGLTGRQVVDRTGLTGFYEGKLEYAPDGGPQMPGEEHSVPDVIRPSAFTALQEQFGLKLEATKGAIETIVIDHAEKPSAN